MKTMWLAGLALSAGLAFAGTAFAQDITVARCGPDDRRPGDLRPPVRRTAPNRRSPTSMPQAACSARSSARSRRRRLRSEAGALGGGETRRHEACRSSVGHYCSSSSIPASDAYLDGGVAADHPGARPIRSSPIAACGTRSAPAAATTSRAVSPPAIWRRISRTRTIAIINDKTTYGKGLADEMKKALNAAGVKEKLYESYNKGDKDFTALVSKLKRNSIDIVYVGGYHQEAGLIVRQMRDQGLKTDPDGGRRAGRSSEFASITGPAGEGVLFTFGPIRASARPPPRSSRSSRTRASIRKATRFTPMPPFRSGRGSREGRHHRSTESCRRHAWRHLGHGARPDLLRQEGRHHRGRLGRLSLGQRRQLRRDHRRQVARGTTDGRAVRPRPAFRDRAASAALL